MAGNADGLLKGLKKNNPPQMDKSWSKTSAKVDVPPRKKVAKGHSLGPRTA